MPYGLKRRRELGDEAAGLRRTEYAEQALLDYLTSIVQGDGSPSPPQYTTGSQVVGPDYSFAIDAQANVAQSFQPWSNPEDLEFAATVQQTPQVSARLPIPRTTALVTLDRNPFIEVTGAVSERHAARRIVVQRTGHVVNGYIKIQFIVSYSSSPKDGPTQLPRKIHRAHPPASYLEQKHPILVSRLPYDFGSNAKLDQIDRKLMAFYTKAICGGRTLLPGSNAWLEIAAVTDSDAGARHAALAFSAGYLLDYIDDEILRKRANSHYEAATKLLTHALNDPSIYQVNKEHATVAALQLLFCDDVVQWELRQQRPKHEVPRWRLGSKLATKILDASDPGHRFWRPEYVQSSAIRQANAIMTAYLEVCALPVTKLVIEDLDSLFPWLLSGSPRDVRTIHGGTGVCPELMHMFAQITQLSARQFNDPASKAFPVLADAIADKLCNYQQYSQLSNGYATCQELLNACVLKDGLVATPKEVTELTAETWVQAARFYMYCRFYRYPRDHPQVRQCLWNCLRCIERMPATGHLFTAQSPFPCIVLSAFVAYEAADRQVLCDWFDTIVSGAGGRSSVPPIYDFVKHLWRWVDSQHFGWYTDEGNDLKQLHERIPWWEIMVDWIFENYGYISIV